MTIPNRVCLALLLGILGSVSNGGFAGEDEASVMAALERADRRIGWVLQMTERPCPRLRFEALFALADEGQIVGTANFQAYGAALVQMLQRCPLEFLTHLRRESDLRQQRVVDQCFDCGATPGEIEYVLRVQATNPQFGAWVRRRFAGWLPDAGD